MKNINATPLIDWFTEKFDVDIVYLVRHPGAVADSLVRRGWKNAAQAYLENTVYRERWLTVEQRRLAQQILDKGSAFQQYVLEWCLDNLYPLRVYKKRSWLTLSYEELVLRTSKVVRLLCERLRLPDPERMLRVLRMPSRTTSVDSKRMVKTEGPGALVVQWLKHINQKEIESMKELLDTFKVEIYKANSPYPAETVCLFGSLVEEG